MNKKKTKQIPPPPDANESWEKQAAYFKKFGLEELEQAGYAKRLTREEKQEMDELSKLAQARISARQSKRTQLNLSFSDTELTRFFYYAQHKHIPPSTLARAWVLERLDREYKKIAS